MLFKKPSPSLISPRPQSFAALMDMYELNYIQLRLLCGDLKVLPQKVIARVEGRVPVLLQVMEQTAHTSTILLTYVFDDQGTEIATRPDLLVRIYHDARQAEVIKHYHGKAGGNSPAWQGHGLVDSNLLHKWRTNRFLHKWVSHLRKQHYYFH